MQVDQRIEAFAVLGDRLRSLSKEALEELSRGAGNENNWFTPVHVQQAIQAWSDKLHTGVLKEWTAPYTLEPAYTKTVGLILAGNIPMVGFHDLLSVLISGHKAKVKVSSQDGVLMNYVIDLLLSVEPDFAAFLERAETLKATDAVIATGSDNSARYFNYYFSGQPHIIRQNRTSVAILGGNEEAPSLKLLGKDLFCYFGLGCRNVSKVWVPEGYEFSLFIEALGGYETILDHHKYRNNYDYNKSIYLINKEPHLDSGFFLIRKSEALVSPIAVLFYEPYNHEEALGKSLTAHQDKIQCIVSENGWYKGSVPFGKAQEPELWDYADGVDTLHFLSQL